MATYSSNIKSMICKATKSYILLGLVFLLYGCAYSKPPLKDYSYKSFNLSTGWESGEKVEFTLELDTVETHTIFMCGIVRNNYTLNNIAEIPIKIKFISSGGVERTYKIELPLNVKEESNKYRKNNGTLEIEWPIISNIINKETGLYSVIIEQNSRQPIYENILGIGIHASKVKQRKINSVNERKR